jgi:PAS domain S-box-containing protein
MLGFGGLLLTLLLVSGLSFVVLRQYRTSLDQFFYENWRSVEYGQNVIASLGKLDEIAATLDRSPSAADIAAATKSAAGPLADGDSNVAGEDHNITLDGEDRLAADLTRVWCGKSVDGVTDVTTDDYRDQYARLLNPSVTGGDRAAAAAAIQRLSPAVRRSAQSVVDLNLSNMRPVTGRAKDLADRAVLLLVSGATAGTLLAILLTLVVTRSIVRPLAALTKSCREIEGGNLDLVVQVKGGDEIGQLAEAFNSMAVRLREYRRTDRAKLIRTQQTTQLAVDSLPDAIAVTTADGTIELSNNAARRLFGLTPGTKLSDGGDRRLFDAYKEVAASGLPSHRRGYESAVEVYDAGGQLRFFLPHAVPISDGDSHPMGVTLVLADVTNLRKLDEMKSGLLSVVSHELKTPLTSIRMALHLLLEERVGPLNPKQTELATAAREDSDRLDKIIAGLLDMGRLESGRAQLELRPETARHLIDDALAPLSAGFHDKGINVDIAVAPETPEVLVDPDRIGHVMTNLLTNAMKFTDPGGRVTLTAAPEGTDRVCFVVADTGVGIPAEHLPRVFDRFFRVPGISGATAGAGLGLAIAREIVQIHGGQIDVQSTPGQGTRFSFTLRTKPEATS